MIERSPYDHSHPAPSEELLGLLTGLVETGASPESGLNAIKIWMENHLSDDELERMSKRDPLWQFQKAAENDENNRFFAEWGVRVKNGVILPPVPGTNYKPRLKLLKS